jgi:hypothetical protein
MLPRPEPPARQLPYTTADMAERLAKKKAEQKAAAEQAKANQALRFGVTNPPVQEDKGGGTGLWPSWGEIGNAGMMGLGAVAGMVNTVGATPLDMADWANQQLVKYVAGKEPEDQFDPASMGSFNLLGETYRGVDRAANYVGQQIAATPGVGKPSSSPFMDTVRSQGWANAIAEPFVHAVNVGSVAYPVSKMAVGAKLPGTIADAYRQRLLERDIAAQNNLFPAVQRPANVIDVDALQGSRLPARIVDSPATPATRLAEAQTTRALPPATQRALPPATTADMVEQLARAQARQQTHFGTVSKEPIDVIQSTEFPLLDGFEANYRSPSTWGTPRSNTDIKQTLSFPVYEIGGEKIAFGNPGLGRFNPEFNAQDVQIIPVDPYRISGLDKTSADGQRYAELMFDANQGLVFEQGGAKNIGQVSALTYAASRGDNVAFKELERLAAIGKKSLMDKRLEATQKILSQNPNWENPNFWNGKEGVRVKTGQKDASGASIYRPMGIDDMFLVHQTNYAPTFDANGNIILKPLGDFPYTDKATGQQMMDEVTGKPSASIDRDTLHFGINHLVGGNYARPAPTSNSNVIIIPLRDVLNANRGSLDNLYAVDTFLTPKPGQGLIIPMQNGKVLYQGQFQADEFNDAVKAAINEVGRRHNRSPEYEAALIEGGGHYANTPNVDKRISQIGIQDISAQYPEYDGGVIGTIHASHPNKTFEEFDNFDVNSSRSALTDSHYWRLSPNARLRIYDSNTSKYTTGEINNIYPEFWGL